MTAPTNKLDVGAMMQTYQVLALVNDCSGKDGLVDVRALVNELLSASKPAAPMVPADLLPNALWTRHGSGSFEWWTFKGYEARKDGADQWVLRKAGTELYRNTHLQVVMAYAERELLAASPAAPDHIGETDEKVGAPAQIALFDDDYERDEFLQACRDFEDAGETAVDYQLLMKWADAGLLECEHFTVTAAGNAEIKRSTTP